MTSEHARQLAQVVQWIDQYCRRNNVTKEQAASNLPMVDPGLMNEALAKIDEIARAVIVRPLGGDVVTGDSPPLPWYLGPDDEAMFWPKLVEALEEADWDSDAIDLVDNSSTKVVAHLANPALDQIETRGLVLGHIQSGKTTNFTAVISKAADAGYRLFIVLSGVSNSLRRQTQLRLDEQLLEKNPLNWIGLTDHRDMGRPQQFQYAGLHAPSIRTLAVVKKNTTRLDNLIEFLRKAQKVGALNNCPILVIDDEADQASLSPKMTEAERTAINDRIVTLLTEFPRVAYVAYTATPFANFFVDPKYPENLYPRDFIISLPEPTGYFGPKQMFGVTDQDLPDLDVVRLVPDAETMLILPPRNRALAEDFIPRMTKSLRDAIRWFFLATTVRRILRDGNQPHSTMMLHTSERVAQHMRLWNVVSKEVERIRDAIAVGDAKEIEAFANLWNFESKTVDPGVYGYEYPPLDEILLELPATLKGMGDLSKPDNETCCIIIDNGSAAKRLLYDNESPKAVIVVGGNTLSRGLTLEGLVSSVFVRSIGLYDTLLQMGRWFGYRRGYESLPRVWMPRNVADRFAHLSRVEILMREEIQVFAENPRVTPKDLGVRILKHPQMQITRQGMMRKVRTVRGGYSAAEVDTVYLQDDVSWLHNNRDAVRAFASACVSSGKKLEIGKSVIFQDVDASLVLDFFAPGGYRVHERNIRFDQESVFEYVRGRNRFGELESWNICFVGTSAGREVNLAPGLSVTTVERGRASSSGDIVFIGDHLTGRENRRIDLPIDPQNRPTRQWRDAQPEPKPLLLLYVVNKDSQPAARGKRDPLAIVEDFYGIGLCFPTSKFPGGDDYVVVDLPPLPIDDSDLDFDDDEDDDAVIDTEDSADDVVGANEID
jgi:hypothetical protein